MIQLNLNCLRYTNVNEIINIIKEYEIVSFDIFDTLLKRDVSSPSEVFNLIEERVGKDFAVLRMQAEKRARRSLNKEEVTLKDIYSFMPLSLRNVRKLEMQYEKKLLTINTAIFPIYEYCRKNHKTIIITSDMYLPQPLLEEVLHANGITFDAFYLSNTVGKQKVTGNLFRYMLDEAKIESKAVVHLGDSIRGDYLGARKAGIKSILIPKRINNTVFFDLYKKKQNTTLHCFINNHIDSEKGNYYKTGFCCFGPVLYGFVQWLHDQVGRYRIFFFSRDGFIIKKAYESIYQNVDSDYLYVSRRSLSVPLLWKYSDWKEIFGFITMTRYFSLRTFLERLGLDPDRYVIRAKEFGLDAEDVFQQASVQTDNKLKKFYTAIRTDVIENSQKEFTALCNYFREKKFVGDVAVVDIGWNGSMQKCLAELMRLADIHVTMHGYYFGIRKQISETSMQGYIYDPKHMQYETSLSFMQGLFESFFLSQEGSTKKYEIKDNIAKPILYTPEYVETDKEFKALKAVQSGALEFCRLFSESILADHAVRKEDFLQNFLAFGTDPSIEEAEWFGDFAFYDTNMVYMAKPGRLSDYLINPKSFLRDFSYAVWKAAFLKRLFRFSVPYCKIYSLLKTLK